jgi:hypothetical protein
MEMGNRKKHVIVDRQLYGGFHYEREVTCRCGWKSRHYNATALKERFAQHRKEMLEQKGEV